MAKRRKTGAGSARIAKAVGTVLIALALVAAVSLVPQQTAEGPRRVAAWLQQGFGQGALVLPGLGLLIGLIIFVQESLGLGARVYGLLLAYVTALVALHLRFPPGSELSAAAAHQGGGYAGAFVAILLRRTLGEPGLWTATVLAGIAAALLLSGRSLTGVLRGIGRGARFLGGALGRAAARLTVASGRMASAAVRVLPGVLAHGIRGVAAAARALAAGVAGLALWICRQAWDAVRPFGRRRRVRAAAQPRSTLAAAMDQDPFRNAERVGATPLSSDLVRRAHSDLEERRTAAIGVDDAVPESAFESAVPDRFAAEEPVGRGRLPDVTRGRRRRKPAAAQELLGLPVEPQQGYTLPPLSLLDTYAPGKTRSGKVDPDEVARSLERTLASFGVEAKVIRWETGPVVTRYELQPAPGVKVQRITSLQSDIALALAASSVRLEAPIPGKAAIGVELPNERPGLVHVREILTSDEFQRSPSPLTVSVGKGIAGQPVAADLVAMPHLLIAGATGAGKSVALNSMIASILFRATPEQVRFLMIDPKRVELTSYNGIPHLLSPVVTGPREAAAKLRWAIQEMENRYALFADDGARNIQAFNAQHPDRPLAYIVIIIDELADLMMVAPSDFEEIICRLAQMTRAVGIHLLVATQRPSVDVITGLIKANIPSRIAFAVTSQVDSRTILDHPGAEKLLGRGDMLFSPIGATRPTRVQGSYISDAESERLVEFWRAQGRPEYVEELLQAGGEAEAGRGDEDDGLLVDAARLVVRAGYGSVSLLQRKMRIGYVRAARLIDQLEEKGIVGPTQGSSPREVLVGLGEMDRVLRTGRARALPGADTPAEA